MLPVSIIIPCFNHGIYLNDALQNLNPINELYEVIIVNDGSNEELTINALEDIEKKEYRVLHTANAGLSSARNAGIEIAQGKYILLLDADNKINPEFIKEAYNLFEERKEIDVIYSDAEYFGDKKGLWKVGEFNLQRLMIHNYIDACAFVRKSVFAKVGGYDMQMKGGLEDWEMWLRIAFENGNFFYWEHVGFYYRVLNTSMSKVLSKSYERRNALISYVHKKYPGKMGHKYIDDYVMKRFKPNPLKFMAKLLLKAGNKNYYAKLVKQNKIIDGI